MAYTNSPLVDCTVKSPNHSGKRTHKIDRITPHCVVGQLSAERIGECFPEGREASCNYGIGTDGRVCLIVDEANRSWCSSSSSNDQRAITIECSSDKTHPYAMNSAVYNKLVELCADICKRNGITKLLWLGDKDTSLAYKFYSPDDALITGIKAIIAEEFSRNLSKKLHNYHDGRIEKARQGLEIDLQGSGNVFGWDKVDGKYVINPEQAKVRRLMCEGIMARKGSTQIAKELNDAGYRNTVGKPWKPMDIPKFVYDCKNVGTMIINRERHDFESKQTVKLPESEWVYVKGALPPIVTEEEWALIEKIHEERVVATGCNRRGKKTSGYSFSGKLVCGVCGAPYWRKTKTSKEEYWVCSTKQQKGRKTRARDAIGGKAGEVNLEGCDNENISYNALMEIMAIVSERLQADTGFIREFMLGRLDTYEKRITEANRGATEADLQREVSRKDKLLDAYLDNLLTKEEYQRKALALDEHILELKREVEANKANLEDLAEIQRVRENIDAEVAQYLDENEQLKVEFVLEHLSQVIIYPDKVLVIFDVFGEGVMVEKSQYVSREKWSWKKHDYQCNP